AGCRRASDACESYGREGPGHQRRRLHLCGRQPGRPAVSRMEAERSVLQGQPADDPLQVQSIVPVHRDDDEARPVRGDVEVSEGPRDPAGRARHRLGYGLSEQLPLWSAAVDYAVLADADAPAGLAAEQEETCACHEVWVRAG